MKEFILSTNGTGSDLSFSEIDYVLFGCILGISTFVGIYYGCFGTKQSSIKDYLQGGKTMSIYPIAMSLLASHLSGATLLGLPAEVYTSGTQYSACIISAALVSIIIINVYLPVFLKLQLISCNEYLQIRFDRRTRHLGSILYIISNLLYMPIVVYTPCLALNQVTGFKLQLLAPIICAVCIFYTTIGGLKAVVSTDALQFTITLITMTVLLSIGTYYSGGITSAFQKAYSTGRIEFFNMSLDPTERSTFWGVTIGLTTTWIGTLGVNPSSIQRYLAVPSYKAAKRSIIIFGVGTVVTKVISMFTGLIMYARYSDCDLLSTHQVKRSDQLLPYYVLDVARNIPGLPGLFIAGIFSTALSTMSTSLNTLAGTIYEDFIKQRMQNDITEKRVHTIMKSIVVIIGMITVALVFVVEKLSGVFQLTLSLNSIATGPMVALFTLGMLFPSVNATGAFMGTILSTILGSILVAGSQYYIAYGKIKSLYKPLYTYGCDFNITSGVNFTTMTTSFEATEKPLVIFSISFYFFTLISVMIAIISGIIISWITKDKREPRVDRDLLSPCIYWLLPKISTDKSGDTAKVVEYRMITVPNKNSRSQEVGT